MKLGGARQASRDLREIGEYLAERHKTLGHDSTKARQRAVARLLRILAALSALGKAPFQGALRPEFGIGVRMVTRENCAMYFVVDEAAEVIRVLGVFWGGQDHAPRMAERAGE